MTGLGTSGQSFPDHRTLLYSHDTFGLGHLRRSRTIATALIEKGATGSALIVTGSPIAGRFDFPQRVDHVRMPGVVKLANGSYTASSLPIDIDHMTRLRGAIIEATARNLSPDLLIVDKEPWGFRQELAETLSFLRDTGTRIVLGVRDVLDDEDLLAREWERKGAVEAIDRFYDEIWIYGMPQICRPLDGLGLSSRMHERVVYTGYLKREIGRPPEPDDDMPSEPYVLVTTGGGGDGRDLVDWVIRAYEDDRRLSIPAVIVYGPFMDARDRAGFDTRIGALGARVTAMAFHSRMERLFAGAMGVVAMGGYNTFCEILTADKPAIIAPRTRPRREQLIRARAAERLGLLRMIAAERDGNGARTMANAIRSLRSQPPPSSVRMPGLMSGLERIVEQAQFRPRRLAGE